MISHILVCPPDEKLLSSLNGRVLIIRKTGLDGIGQVIDTVRELQIKLHCLWILTGHPLSRVPFHENWQGVPLAIFASDLGNFRDFMKQLPLIRKMDIRVYLPATDQRNYTSIRILSSLGIPAALILNNNGMNWELLSDLMSYAYFGLVPHAPIEPFNYIAEKYNRNQHTDFSSVFFQDQSRFLYLNEEGCVALSLEELEQRIFLSQDINELENIHHYNDYTNRLVQWRNYFLEDEGCAYCQGWRVCLGKFSSHKKEDGGCKNFFIELMDSIERYQTLQNGGKRVWHL